jgi:endonuclease G
MKAIQYHLLIVAVLTGLLMYGCDKGEGETPPQEPLAATLYGSSYFKWNAQGRFLTISTTKAWTVTFSYPDGAPAGWCSASPSSGTGNKNVWIATATNNTTAVRQATVVVATDTENISIDIAQYSANDALPASLKNHLELPKVEDPEWLLNYEDGDYTIEYSTAKKHSKWVAWPLYKSHMGSSGRTNAWQFDGRIPEAYRPTQQDFSGSGYDRGHLCPSADRTQSRSMNAQTFMYSNMSPQLAGLNQKIWATLEDRVRGWAGGADTLYICAGGTILKESNIQGYTTPSSMAVPKYYFKVVLRKKAVTGALDAIGFWFENKDYGKESLSSKHVKTIDEIETLTGLDFFYLLPAAEQDRVEAAFAPSAFGL